MSRTFTYLGDELRKLRKNKRLLLRQVAATADIDTAFLSKVERGERTIGKEHISKLAMVYNTEPGSLIKLWLCDKILQITKQDSEGPHAIEMALKELKSDSLIGNIKL